jgi:sec-independent protein translocase protein TatC
MTRGKVKKPQTPKNRSSGPYSEESDTKTFLEHVQELRNRLFWVAIVLILASAVAYPFFDKILDILVAPLGNQQLHYLTPAGGFSFMLKVCMYTGIIVAIPMMIYQLFRYIQPAMRRVKNLTILGYISASIVLAATGIVLAYFVSLPAALHFLTDFNLPQITAMLTADSYFSFVMTYLLAAAILFQLPLILMIINNVTPMSPGGMMKQQRYVIVIAFILGAIISPTPDALNQALLAGPIVIMYQLGIFLVMIQNATRKKQYAPKTVSAPVYEVPIVSQKQVIVPPPTTLADVPVVKKQPRKVFFSDVILPITNRRSVPTVTRSAPKLQPPSRPAMPRRKSGEYVRSIDGFAIDA